MAELNDSFADNLQQKEERDVDISRGVDPFITGAIIALGGGAFTPDASELISGRMEQMLLSQTHQFRKPLDFERVPAFNVLWQRTSNPPIERRLTY